MSVTITSLQNRRIKRIVKLRNRRHRDDEQVTIVEGVREISQALLHNRIPLEAYVCREIAEADAETADLLSQLDALASIKPVQMYEVTPELFAKIAYRGESGGLLFIFSYWHVALNELPLKINPFILVVENAEKPGNLGAILRTADACGIDALIVCHSPNASGTDVFNPNVIRASLGAVFSVTIIIEKTNHVIDWLHKRNICILAATPDGDVPYTSTDMLQSIAIVTGSEALGLSSSWLTHADYRIVIPMQGVVDSLNLSVSTALLLYETVRQRGSLKHSVLSDQPPPKILEQG